MNEQWFSKESFVFLEELKANNSKKWYMDNKGDYEQFILEPIKDFVYCLSSTMLNIDNEIEVRPQIGKTISRIFRDTRFSNDKSLFKDRMWVTFKRYGTSNSDFPAFFFELTPYSFRYGMGFFSASPKSMSSLRDLIDKKEALFLEIANKIKNDDIFTLEGKMYKKNYYQGSNEELAAWYNRKNIYLVYNSNVITELFERGKIEQIKEEFKTLEDIYNFFILAISGNRTEIFKV